MPCCGSNLYVPAFVLAVVEANIILAQVISGFLICLNVANLILRSTAHGDYTGSTWAASALGIAAACALSAILYVEHLHAIRASAFLGIYLFLTALLDGTECRSYITRSLIPLGVLRGVSAAVRLVLLVLEEVPKVNLLIDPIIRNASGGEATSGFWSRTFFFFMSPIFRSGFRDVLRVQNLTAIGIEFSSKRLLATLLTQWQPQEKKNHRSLFVSCCMAWKPALFAVLLPRVCLAAAYFSQPFSMRAVIRLVSQEASDRETRDAIIGATLLSFGTTGLCKAISLHMKHRLVCRVRGGLISQVMDKSLRLKSSTAKKNSAISLISADLGSITDGLPFCVEIPFAFIESAIGVFLLARFIKQSSFVIVFPLLFATVASIIFGHYTAPAIKVWNQAIEDRVSKTSRLLSQLPAVKMLGLGPKTIEYLQYLRTVEVEKSKKYRAVQAGAIATASFSDLITPTTVVAAALFWGTFGDTLSPDIVYPTLAVVALVQRPLSSLFRAYPAAKAMLACFGRVEAFLCQEEHHDQRTIVSRSSSTRSGTAAQADRDADFLFRCEGATIAPYDSEEAVLNNVSFVLPKGSISTLFGTTGSGKTTLMHGILGEAALLAGKVHVHDVRISLCGQLVWLPNDSLLNCIIGFCAYDEIRFNIVVACCQLVEDIRQLPGGVDYIVGSGGCRLSGGQRARVALARAAYAREKLVVLDDPLSSLDHDTACTILQGLCGKDGLFRESGSTVILSGHLPEYLGVADQVLLLDGAGNLDSEASATNGPVQARVRKLLNQNDQKPVHCQQQDQTEAAEPASGPASSALPAQNEAQRQAERARKEGDLSLYLFWMNHVGCMAFLAWFIAILLTAVADSLPRIYLSIWMAKAPENKQYFVGYAILPVICACLCGGSLLYLFNMLCPRAALGLHRRLTETAMQATLGFLTQQDSGSLLNHFSLDMNILSKNVPPNTHNTFYLTLGTLVQMNIVLVASKYIAILVPFIMAILFYLQRFYLRTSRQLRHLDLEAQAPLVTSLRESAEGLVYIRGFGWQSHDIHHKMRLLDESQKPIYLLYCAQTLLGLVLDLLVAVLATVLVAVILHMKSGPSGNSTGLSLLALIFLGSYFNAVIESWTQLETSIGSLARLRSFIENTPKETDEGTTKPPPDWPAQGKVVIRDLKARYRVDETPQPAVLEDVTISAKPGHKIGIMGRTGSGKSSLLLAMLGFLDYEGTISIDGIDIATVPRDELRSRVITISQDQVEFDGTIRDNLLPFDMTWDAERAERLQGEKTSDEITETETVLRDTLERLCILGQD